MSYILKQTKQNLYYKCDHSMMGRTYPLFTGDKSKAFKFAKDEADKMADELNLVVEEYNT